VAHRERICKGESAWTSWRLTISAARALGSVTHRAENWNRSNFFWDTSQCKPQNATLAANSEFNPR